MAFRSVEDTVVLLDIEGTYGVTATMTGADAIVAMNPQIRLLGEKLTRPLAKTYLGGDPFVLVGKRVELSFDCDIIGAATAGNASPYGKLYRACGYSETLSAGVDAVYAPRSSSFESATVHFYWGGIRFILLGARGALDIEFSIDKYLMGKVKLIGTFAVPTDQSNPSVSFTAFQAPQAIEVGNSSLTVGSYSAHARSFTMQANAAQPFIATTESEQVVWTGRKPTGELLVMLNDALTTWNPFTLANNHTVNTITATISGSAGRNVEIVALCQFGMPEATDVEKSAALRIPLDYVPSSGDDDHVITFT